MRIERAVEIPVSSALALQGLADISARDLGAIAELATSSGEALLEKSGLVRLDEANACHFGAQLARILPLGEGPIRTLQLRWWNDKARSLTPGFIGEVQVRSVADQLTELAIVGQYYPRAHLYELGDPALLGGMATAVVASLLERLRDRILHSTSRPAEVHSVAS